MDILKFQYRVRPELPVMFTYGSNQWHTMAVVDSGSDITYLPHDIARMVLKMPLRAQPETIDAAGGKDFRGIPQRVTLAILDERGKEQFSFPRTKIYVADRHYTNDHTVLGTDSLFSRFDVTIRATRKEIELAPI